MIGVSIKITIVLPLSGLCMITSLNVIVFSKLLVFLIRLDSTLFNFMKKRKGLVLKMLRFSFVVSLDLKCHKIAIQK